MSHRDAVTFVLPGRNRSGGVRATVEMANGLVDRGHRVRIAYRAGRGSASRRAARALRRAALRARRLAVGDWLDAFQGEDAPYRRRLSELAFAPGEVVIAVGSLTVREVVELPAPVLKVRYCHGFTQSLPELQDYAWGVPMDTIAVSPGLLPELERRGGRPALAVVPNGIHLEEYHPEPGLPRDGVGTIYHEHPSKAPAETLALLARIRERWPDLPQRVFGMAPRPAGVPRDDYTRSPSVDAAREIYGSSRVWLMTSRHEGFGLPLLEAMACGTPVVSTAIYGCEGLVRDGENGYVVPFGAWDEFVERVGELLADDERWRKMSEEAVATAQRFTWSRAVDLMERCLRDLRGRSEGVGNVGSTRA